MASASYSVRPRSESLYKNGRKRSIGVRLLMRFFPCKGDGFFEGFRKIVFLGALGSFVYFGGGFLFGVGNDLYQQWKVDEKMKNIFSGSIEIPDEMRERVLERKPDMLPNYIEHYDFNNDLVGHILVPDMSSSLGFDDLGKYIINYLVYQTDNNDYYLERTFDHRFSEGGSIFADFRNRFDGGQLSGNTVLYGHNIITGNYFTRLTRYYQGYENRDLTFYKKHPLIRFNTLYEEMYWKVFAVVLFNTQEQHGDVFKYIFPEFTDREHFNEFILGVMDRSVLFTEVDLTYGDHILTLSTCYYPFGTNIDTRVAVFARRVRDGESIDVDVDKATHNTGFLPFDLQARRMGNTWNGRVWDTSLLLSYDG